MANDSRLAYEPKSVPHAGETVAEYLEFKGWSQRDLARRTGLTPKTISEICSGNAPISPKTALAFESVFGRPAHFWLNLQRQYEEAQARSDVATVKSKWSSWASKFPIKEMERYGWLEGGSSKDAQLTSLLTFFGVSSPESWESVWKAADVAFRQTRNVEPDIAAVSAWVRATELLAAEIETKPFDEARLRQLMPELLRQTRDPAEKFIPRVESLCASAGVAVVWTPELSHTGISGCARWLTPSKALVALTLRYKFDDQIWFSFFHEIGHILLHHRRYAFILDNAFEDLADGVVDPQIQKEEEEANRFASDTLIPPKALSAFMAAKVFTNPSIHKFADDLGVGPGIVVGRLQREGALQYHQGNTLKRRFDWSIPGEDD